MLARAPQPMKAIAKAQRTPSSSPFSLRSSLLDVSSPTHLCGYFQGRWCQVPALQLSHKSKRLPAAQLARIARRQDDTFCLLVFLSSIFYLLSSDF